MAAALVSYLPLLVAALILGVMASAPVSTRVNALLTRIALASFGEYVTGDSARAERRSQLLRAAHSGEMYRVYASKTVLYSALLAVVGSVAGLYAIILLFSLLSLPAATLRSIFPSSMEFLATGLQLPQLSVEQLFLVFLLSSTVFGSIAGVVTYVVRWQLPSQEADQRSTRIDESLPRTVAFVFALSRSGMDQSRVLRTLARNREAYGEAAEELTVAVREMDLLGRDLLTALERIGEESPSDQFTDFAENFAGVLRSGQRISEYLREEYEQYQSEKESRQDRLLDQFAALAEGYVALLVAGPLFLITLLVVFGLLLGGTINVVRVLVYLIVPLGNAGYVAYLDSLTTGMGMQTELELSVDEERHGERALTGIPTMGGLADARERANAERLAAYNRMRTLQETVFSPVSTAVREPMTLLYVTVPIAVVWIGAAIYGQVVTGGIDLRTLDDAIVQATLLVLSTFGGVYYLHSRRLERVEEDLPDFLDRLASKTEAGMTLTRSIERIRLGDEDAGIDREVRRVIRDVQWGGRTARALERFARRIGSPAVSRAVVLITNAMEASTDLAPVLRIAADEAQADRQLKRERQQELLIYTMIIYITFLVFIGIVVALDTVFIPNIPSDISAGGGGGGGALPGGGIGGIGGGASQELKDAYSLVFFHSAMIQAVLSGLVAGKMSEGTIKAGAKHATVMLAIAYVLFSFL